MAERKRTNSYAYILIELMTYFHLHTSSHTSVLIPIRIPSWQLRSECNSLNEVSEEILILSLDVGAIDPSSVWAKAIVADG